MEKPVTLLYVDDEPINLLLFKQIFSKKYTVLVAESGHKGLEILHHKMDIRVIISDMKMPGMNGIEFIKQAKESNQEILFYILTGYEITPEIQRALEDGLIIDYFQKPFNMREIDDAITHQLAKS